MGCGVWPEVWEWRGWWGKWGELCHRYAVPLGKEVGVAVTVGWHPRLRLCQPYGLAEMGNVRRPRSCNER